MTPMDMIPMSLPEDVVEAQQPLIRAQLVQQLLGLVDLCDTQIRQGEEEGHVDPRFAELKLRTLDRLARMYRLLDKVKPVEAEEEGPSAISQEQTRQLVLDQLLELERRTG